MKAKNTFAVVFFTRKSRSVPNQSSIYVRITVDGKRTEISLKRNVTSKNWDNARNRVKGSSLIGWELNSYMDSVYGALLVCHKELLEENRVITAEAIKSHYLGEDDKNKTLRDFVSYHNERMSIVLNMVP